MKNSTILFIVIIVLVLTGVYVFLIRDAKVPVEDNADTNSGLEIRSYSLEEISMHNSKDSCWLLIEGKIYDVTEFIALGKHNKYILEGCGKDASNLFNKRKREDGTNVGSGTPHSNNSKNMLDNYYIGYLE